MINYSMAIFGTGIFLVGAAFKWAGHVVQRDAKGEAKEDSMLFFLVGYTCILMGFALFCAAVTGQLTPK